MFRIILPLVACLAVAVHPARAQDPLSEQEALRYLGICQHGVCDIPEDEKRRVLGDTATLDFYADLLQGRRLTTARWYRSMALLWLLRSGDPGYVPVFLRYAVHDTSAYAPQTYIYAVYGLARHAGNPEARARLLDLGRCEVQTHYRHMLAEGLLRADTAAAREILRSVYIADFSQIMRRAVAEMRSPWQ